MATAEQQRPAPETTFRVMEEDRGFILEVTVESKQRPMVTRVWTGRIEIGGDGLPAVRKMDPAPIEDTPVEQKTIWVPSQITQGTKSAERILQRVARLCQDASNLEEERIANGGESQREKAIRERMERADRERVEQTPRTMEELQRLSRQDPQPVTRGGADGRAEESLQTHLEAFRKEREAWMEAAWNLPHHNGSWHRMTDPEDRSVSYSFLGAGLQAIMDRNPGEIRWNEPESTRWGQPAEPGEDMEFQSVDNTTMTLCDRYALSPQQVDLLDELDAGGLGVEELNRRLQEADYTFSFRQDERTIQVQRTADRARRRV